MGTSSIGGDVFAGFFATDHLGGPGSDSDDGTFGETGGFATDGLSGDGNASSSFASPSLFGSVPSSGSTPADDTASLFGWPFGNASEGSVDEKASTEFITEKNLAALKTDSDRVEALAKDIADTPVFLYHGFTDTDNRRPDIPELNRSGFDVNIDNFEKDLRAVLDRGGEIVTTRDIVEKHLRGEEVPDDWHVVRIDDGDQTTALAVDVVKELQREYPDRTIKLELGINAATVGSPGTDERYEDSRFAIDPKDVNGEGGLFRSAKEDGYYANAEANELTDLSINDRKVTWEELGNWVENDYVEVSNHGFSHLVHASQQKIDANKEGDNPVPPELLEEDGTALRETTVRDEIDKGERLIESKISEAISEDYEVTTFIWPRGDFDNEHSGDAFDASGHVIGLGTGEQSSSSIPTGRFDEPYGDTGDYYDAFVDPIGRGESSAATEWDYRGLPAVTVNTDD